ncbi:Uncharacterized protein NEOC65_001616 [Neochlamydia sp. AcF65]|nr:Uncharacterized protein [Neochlamydia sp. AcF65]MBS4170048.1 Uncharacterized protein [Neochlamydia sp. AcF95]
MVFNSSGVKVYSEREWKAHQHGKAKRRICRKIHLAICPDSHKIILRELIKSNKVGDSVASQMIFELPKSVQTAYRDGAYDRQASCRSSYVRDIDPLVPPKREGRLS